MRWGNGDVGGGCTSTSLAVASLQEMGRCRSGWQQQTTEWFKEVRVGLKTSRVCLFSPRQENIKTHSWKLSLKTQEWLSIALNDLSIWPLLRVDGDMSSGALMDVRVHEEKGSIFLSLRKLFWWGGVIFFYEWMNNNDTTQQGKW